MKKKEIEYKAKRKNPKDMCPLRLLLSNHGATIHVNTDNKIITKCKNVLLKRISILAPIHACILQNLTNIKEEAALTFVIDGKGRNQLQSKRRNCESSSARSAARICLFLLFRRHVATRYCLDQCDCHVILMATTMHESAHLLLGEERV